MADPKEMLQNARREYTAALGLAERWRKVVDALESAIEAGGPRQLELSAPGKPELAKLSGPGAAAAVLSEIGRPLHVMKLIAEMQSRGYRTGDPPTKIRQALVGALLKKGGKFRKVERGVYGLAKWG